MTYTSHSYGVKLINTMVTEMHPVTFDNILGKIAFALMGFLIILFTKEKFSLHLVLISLGMMILALSANRSLGLFMTLGLIPVAYYFRHWQGMPEADTKNIKVNKRFCVIMMILILGTYGYGLYQSKVSLLHSLEQVPLLIKATIFFITLLTAIIELRYGRIKRVRSLPIRLLILGTVILTMTSLTSLLKSTKPEDPIAKQAVEYILANDSRPDIVIWTGYAPGDYAEFRGLRPYIDPRAEVFLEVNNHQKDILQEYHDLMSAAISYQEFLSRYDFDYLLTEKGDLLYTYLNEDPNYELVLEYEGKSFGQDSGVRLYKPITK